MDGSRAFAKRSGILVGGAFFLFLLFLAGAPPCSASDSTPTVVLPLRSLGVSDTTVSVAGNLLEGALEIRGVPIIRTRDRQGELPSGSAGCDEPGCARHWGAQLGAEQVVYGSLSRLGERIITRIGVLRLAENEPFYRDQFPGTSEGDLERVMIRVAEAIAAGRPNSGQATIESVIEPEERPVRLRASRRGIGVRAGFLFPTGDSYGGTDRLTSLSLPYKYESRNYLVETTTVLGLAFNDEVVDWTIFDLYGARIFGVGDMAVYLGGGVGIHSVHDRTELPPTEERPYAMERSQTATTLTADLGGGALLFRTYDFQIFLDVRYHYVFEDFDEVDGNGAQGIRVTFGTHR
ncbi:MAG: hypothetical protein KAY32_03965 [Candidatus Eisenbacteria sp.]|nr:hypothetical protein [Candidatus Eisenbacteria bacterium]